MVVRKLRRDCIGKAHECHFSREDYLEILWACQRGLPPHHLFPQKNLRSPAPPRAGLLLCVAFGRRALLQFYNPHAVWRPDVRSADEGHSLTRNWPVIACMIAQWRAKSDGPPACG